MAQLATTFVQYSIELGRPLDMATPSTSRDRFSLSSVMVRRVETPTYNEGVQSEELDSPLDNDKLICL